jgi:hypothetical protein
MVRRGLERVAELGRPPFVLQVLTGVDPQRFPALAALARYWAPARARDQYDVGLAALVEGLLSEPPQP